MAGRFSLEAIFSGKDRLSAISGKISSNFSKMAASAHAPLKAISGLNDKIVSGLAGVAEKALLATAALGGLSVVGLGLSMAKASMDFEQAITNVGAVSLRTRDQIGSLEEKAVELARDTQYTATQAANAMEIMARAGFKDTEILAGVGGVLDTAAASGLDMAEAAGYVTHILRGMGLEASQTAHVADVLAMASKEAGAPIAGIGEAMGNVAATARAFNVPLESVIAGVSLLQRVGIDASTSGSAMSTMMTKMAKPTDEIKNKMKAWGVTFQDAHHNMLPFEQVLANISKASKKAGGNMDKVAFLADLVGLRGEKAALQLGQLFETGEFSDLTEKLKDADGAARKMANIRLGTLTGDVTLLKSSFELVEDAAFASVSKGIRPVISHMTEWLNVNKDMVASKSAEYFQKFVTLLPEVAIWAGRAWNMVKVLLAVSAGIKAVTIVTGIWNAVAAANPWVLAFGAVLAAAMLLVAFWPEIKQFLSNHQVAIALVLGPIGALVIAIYAVRTASMATAAAQAIAQGAHYAYAAAAGVAASANGGLGVSFLALLGPIAAVGVAAAAVLALYDQVSKLNAETGGAGVTGTIGNMITYGTLDPAKANDMAMNDEAQHRAANDHSAGLAPRHHYYQSEDDGSDKPAAGGNTTNELVVSPAPGTKAAWKNAPKKGTPIKLKPSGAF